MKNTSPTLQIAKSQLTAVQRTVVEFEGGPLLVLAGPGSGKTGAIASRIAHLLEESQGERFRILALTFTNRAADEMRKRVSGMSEEAEARLFVGTFHSFCADLLRQNGSLIKLASDFTIYGRDEDRLPILKDAIKSLVREPDDSDVDPRKLLAVIDRLSARLVAPSDAAEKFRNRTNGEYFAAVYAAYEERLIAEGALDFNGIVYHACEILKRFPGVVRQYQTTYRYVLVDEFQDTNEGQYKFLRLLTQNQQKPNVCAVGDEDQIIYQWNGASYSRVEEFVNDFSAAVIQFPVNFRCPFEIVQLANNLIQNNFHRTKNKAPLAAAKLPSDDEAQSGPVTLLEFESQDREAEVIATRVAIEVKLEPSKSRAVLARNRGLLEPVLSELVKRGVKAKISQRRDSFQSPPYQWLHAALKLANDRANRTVFQQLSSAFSLMFGLPSDVQAISDEAIASHGDLLRVWVEYFDEDEAPDFRKQLVQVVRSTLVNKFDPYLFSSDAVKAFDREYESLKDEPFPGYIDDRKAWRELSSEIVGSLGRSAPFEAFLQELEIRSKEPSLEMDTVALLTIHGSKGNEFDTVFLIGLAEDVLPSFQSKQGNPALLEEERRNCFVAITRASEKLVLSWAHSYRGWKKARSRFLAEMGL